MKCVGILTNDFLNHFVEWIKMFVYRKIYFNSGTAEAASSAAYQEMSE